MKTQTMKPMSLYFPISRIDEEKRIVEGIAFANEVVDGEGGIRLRASAMENATADYMKYGTIRSMHQPSAAGTAVPNDPEIAALCGVTWSDVGGKRVATLRSYISDDNDWKKVKDGTYKGYSVGVAPKVMRGKNVESCTWYETSLVDRPKDPGALLTTFRVDGMPDEVEVEQLEDEKVAELNEQYTRLAGSTSFTDAQKVDLLSVIERSIVELGGEVEGIFIPEKPVIPAEEVERGQMSDDVPKRIDYDAIETQDHMDAAVADIAKAGDDEDVLKMKSKLMKIANKKGLNVPKDWTAPDEPEEKPDSDKDAKRFQEYADAIERKDWDKAARDALSDTDFGWPEEKKYPIADQEDMDAATKLVGRAPENMQSKIKSKLIAIAKRKDLKLPEAWEDEKRTAIPTITRAEIELALGDDELIINRSEWDTTIQRVQELETKIYTTEAELTRVQGLVTTAEGEIQRLKDMPTRVPPLRNLSAAERVFGHTVVNPEAATITELQRQKKELEATPPANQAEAEKQAALIMHLDHQLARLGA